MRRQFYARHPETNKPISMIEGELGYVVLPNIQPDKTIETGNALYGNTIEDVQIAIGCSMFGWDIPMADKLS